MNNYTTLLESVDAVTQSQLQNKNIISNKITFYEFEERVSVCCEINEPRNHINKLQL